MSDTLVRIQRSRNVPIREGLTWEQLWLGPDGGLIWCWERGRQKRIDEPDLAAAAERGELPVLAWKGGVEKRRQDQKPITGTLEYLAVWQGLRGEDLDIDRSRTITLVCTATSQAVEFGEFPPPTAATHRRKR
ncbi:MAG: hypothetical protein NZ703_14195 [Gemmataceae bacterium]|nr:hypothetical protein [Gemmataceae bacterium]MCS7272229.1 hypothetical protein [Gemmataceae bacterium]MDW8244033.1 hypothetical protein [Thermogemmata sp.]